MGKIWVVVLPDCERRRPSQKIGVPKRIRWNNELFQNFIFTDESSIWLNRHYIVLQKNWPAKEDEADPQAPLESPRLGGNFDERSHTN